MSFHTVRIIRNGQRRGESGQAFAELTVSLIAILAVFVGFLLIAALCSDRVTTLISARTEADQKSMNGVSSQEGESIQRWDYGADGIPYTTDDSTVPGSGGDGALFKRQLTDNTGNVTLQNPPGSMSQLRSDFTMLQDNNIFVNAASLASGKDEVSDSLGRHYDNDASALKSAALFLFGISRTHVQDTVYMPAHKDPTDERDD